MLSLVRTLCVVSTLAVSVAAQVDHQVVVGGASGKVYTPSQITAAVGDTVTFVFSYMNHTVTQSAFATPCEPLVNGSQTGFSSGYQAVPMNATEAPAWTLEITSAAPIWFSCLQTGHCQSGMVGAINAPATGNKTFDAFKALAMGGNSTTPAGVSPSTVASGVGAGASGSASSVPASAASGNATAGASPTAGAQAGAGTKFEVGTTVVGLGLIAGCFIFF